MTSRQLQSLARSHGTPIVIIDHDIIRANYAAFKKHLPKIQAYYAVGDFVRANGANKES